MNYMPTSNDIGTGIRAELAGGWDAFIARGILVSSSDSAAIVGTSGYHNLSIQGTVSAVQSAIRLGADQEAHSSNSLVIGGDGYVASLGQAFAIDVRSINSRVTNEGGVWASAAGISMGGDGGGGKSVLVNSGSIRAEWVAIRRTGDEDFVLRNSGDIIAGYDGSAFASVDASRDRLINTGTISGSVELGGGSDYFDSIRGTVEGRVTGWEGDDHLLLGAGNDRISGGAGNDILHGGSGQDTFIFDHVLDDRSNVDRVLDFAGRDDTFELGNLSFAGLKVGALDKTAFTSGKSGKALDAGDRIIYDIDGGQLLYDADGKGGEAAVLFTRLSKNLAITHRDFVVFNQLPSFAGDGWDV